MRRSCRFPPRRLPLSTQFPDNPTSKNRTSPMLAFVTASRVSLVRQSSTERQLHLPNVLPQKGMLPAASAEVQTGPGARKARCRSAAPTRARSRRWRLAVGGWMWDVGCGAASRWRQIQQTPSVGSPERLRRRRETCADWWEIRPEAPCQRGSLPVGRSAPCHTTMRVTLRAASARAKSSTGAARPPPTTKMPLRGGAPPT